jgi:hypothetical protein
MTKAARTAPIVVSSRVKRRYDPTNLFHRNLNIRPAETSSQL